MSNKYLVIVESPSKCQKIADFLNSMGVGDFRVEASFGHIREILNLKSIDFKNDFAVIFTIIKEKEGQIKKLKSAMKDRQVILATDPDREGEGIAYHVAEVLGIPIKDAKRMTFNEITKKAVQDAFKKQRGIDMNLVDAQKARQILDITVGYEISPLLWKFIAKKLSAGRVQSPALRLVAEREESIKKQLEGLTDETKRVVMSAIFKFDCYSTNIQAKSTEDFPISPEKKYIDAILNGNRFKYETVKGKTNITESRPPAPFVTSTIQQEASSRFGFSPKSTMSMLQKLYEAGRITYMRTDSATISADAISEAKDVVMKKYGREYSEPRGYNDKKNANAQEAHECIRPTHISEDLPRSVIHHSSELLSSSQDDGEDDKSIVDTASVKTDPMQKLYDLIWCRTVASQMVPYKEEQTPITIQATSTEGKKVMPKFMTFAQKTLQLGWKKVYNVQPIDTTSLFNCKLGELLSINAEEKMDKVTGHYTEASLIHELEKMGIGRPSTFASIMDTIQERGYVLKDSRSGRPVELKKYTKEGNGEMKTETRPTHVLKEKNKLYLSDLGFQVNKFLLENFSMINNYELTAEIEERLDKVAKGNEKMAKVIRDFYDKFHPKVEQLSKCSSSNDVLNGDEDVTKACPKSIMEERVLGKHPKLNKSVKAIVTPRGMKIVIEGDKDGEFEKEAWVKLTPNIQLSTITLEEAVLMLDFPKKIGSYDENDVILKRGPYGYYFEWNGNNHAVPQDKQINIMDFELNDAIDLIKSKKEKVIKEFKTLSILNGPYGPYVKKGSTFASVPKDRDPSKLTLKEAEEIIKDKLANPRGNWGKGRKKATNIKNQDQGEQDQGDQGQDQDNQGNQENPTKNKPKTTRVYKATKTTKTTDKSKK